MQSTFFHSDSNKSKTRMNLACHSSNTTIHYDSLLPSILAHFLQLINLIGNNLPNRHQLYRGTLFPEGRLHSLLSSLWNVTACHGLAKEHCCPFSPRFAIYRAGTAWEDSFSQEMENSSCRSATCAQFKQWSPWEQGRAGWLLPQPLKVNKYSSFSQLSWAQLGRREEGKKKDKDTNAHPGAVREEWWLVQLPGMMPCPREASGSQNGALVWSLDKIFESFLGPFYTLLRFTHPPNSSCIFRPKKNTIKMPRRFSRQLFCYIKPASILNSASVQLLIGQDTSILNY